MNSVDQPRRNTYVNFLYEGDEFSHVMKWHWCIHGCYDGTRSAGTRSTKSFNYTGCEAHVKVLLVKKEHGELVLRVVSEVSSHLQALLSCALGNQ